MGFFTYHGHGKESRGEETGQLSPEVFPSSQIWLNEAVSPVLQVA